MQQIPWRLDILPDGTLRTLQHDAIVPHQFGRATMTRLSQIEFHTTRQAWVILDLHGDPWPCPHCTGAGRVQVLTPRPLQAPRPGIGLTMDPCGTCEGHGYLVYPTRAAALTAERAALMPFLETL